MCVSMWMCINVYIVFIYLFFLNLFLYIYIIIYIYSHIDHIGNYGYTNGFVQTCDENGTKATRSLQIELCKCVIKRISHAIKVCN